MFVRQLTPVDPDLFPLDLPIVSSDDDRGADNIEDDEFAVVEGDDLLKKENFSVLPLDDVEDENDDGMGDSASETSEELGDEVDESINGPLLSDVAEKGQQSKHFTAPARRRTMSGWFKNKFGKKEKPKIEAEEVVVAQEISESTENIDPDFEMESIGDLRYFSFIQV